MLGVAFSVDPLLNLHGCMFPNPSTLGLQLYSFQSLMSLTQDPHTTFHPQDFDSLSMVTCKSPILHSLMPSCALFLACMRYIFVW